MTNGQKGQAITTSDPDVTFNVSDTQYLVVWQQKSDAGVTANWDIWGQIVATGGSTVTNPFPITVEAQDQVVPAVTCSVSDTEYLVVWQSYTTTGSNNDVHGRRVDREGNLLGERIDVATGSRNQRLPKVTYAGEVSPTTTGQYLVVWEWETSLGSGDWDVSGQRVDGDGDTVGSAIAIYSGTVAQRRPAVAYDPSSGATGEYLAIWPDYRSGSNWDVYGQRIAPSGSLPGEEVLLSAEPADDAQEKAAVAYGSEQEMHLVVWEDDRDDNDDVYGQLVSGGGALVGDAFTIAGSASYHERAPAVAYDLDHDEFLVVWEQQAKIGIPDLNIYAQRVDGDGNLVGSALAICTNGTNQAAASVVYNAEDGYFLVAWADYRNGDWDIYARAVVTSKLQSEFAVYTDLASNDQHYPDVAANEPDGEYLVVWQHDNGSDDDVYGRRTGITQTIGSAFTVTTAADNQQYPAVTFNISDTQYLVVWRDGDEKDYDVHGRRVDADGDLLGSELTLASGAGDQLYPDVAWDSSSKGYAVVWQHGSSNGDVHGLILDSGAAVIEAETTLAAASNAQERPAIAYDSDLDRYLVVWEDHRHSTDEADIYGQIYAGHSRVIDYEYDPLGRLTSADYSTGEAFSYTYDQVGNRNVVTSVTPLSGTVVTTYTWDAANRLTDREVSDGRSYTYTWSLRNELLAEWTLGYDVRTFSYNAAGRMISATVFTLTTYFTYAGDGTRVAVEVEGYGTTEYVPDYTRRWRVLMEQTATTETLYLYGRECIGERRDNEWLYHHLDGTGYVRVITDEDGAVYGTWLFDPDGTVLEGPEGPISHLICGGIYDWSTGLIYKDGRYFDPMLGIWLAMMPLAVIQWWRRRKKKGRKAHGFPWYVVVLVVGVGVSGVLMACGPEQIDWEEICVEKPRMIEPKIPRSSQEVNVIHWSGPNAKPNGEHDWKVRFELTNSNHNGGWIVQYISSNEDMYDPLSSEWVTTSIEFWEAWKVKAGRIRSNESWGSWDDHFFMGYTGQPYTKGWKRVTAIVKFYEVDTVIPRPGACPGGWGAQAEGVPADGAGWCRYNPRTLAGAIPSTTSLPPFWDNTGSAHNFEINWDGQSSWGFMQREENGVALEHRWP